METTDEEHLDRSVSTRESPVIKKFIDYIRRHVSWLEAARLIAWVWRNARLVLRWLRKHPHYVVLRLVRARA